MAQDSLKVYQGNDTDNVRKVGLTLVKNENSEHTGTADLVQVLSSDESTVLMSVNYIGDVELAGDLDVNGAIAADSFVGDGSGLTELDVSSFASGVIPTANLGSGSATGATVLRGDQSYAAGVTGGWTTGGVFTQTITNTSLSGSQVYNVSNITLNQVTGTASNIVSQINVTATATGSGTQKLASWNWGGSEKFSVDKDGDLSAAGDITLSGSLAFYDATNSEWATISHDDNNYHFGDKNIGHISTLSAVFVDATQFQIYDPVTLGYAVISASDGEINTDGYNLNLGVGDLGCDSVSSNSIETTTLEGVDVYALDGNFSNSLTTNFLTVGSDAVMANISCGNVSGANLYVYHNSPTPGDAIVLYNNAAATSEIQVQMSPAVRWHGSGWKTNATAASQTVDFTADVLPAAGATAPTGTWRLRSSIDGGAYADRFTVDSSGNVTIPGAYQTTATQLAFSFTGDEYGGGTLLLRNRQNENGAIFSNSAGAASGIYDLMFSTTGGSLQLRTEGRAAQYLARETSGNVFGHFGSSGDPVLMCNRAFTARKIAVTQAYAGAGAVSNGQTHVNSYIVPAWADSTVATKRGRLGLYVVGPSNVEQEAIRLEVDASNRAYTIQAVQTTAPDDSILVNGSVSLFDGGSGIGWKHKNAGGTVTTNTLAITDTATSGTLAALSIVPTYNQASGTAANTDLLINRTQTAVGSGAQLLIDTQVSGTSKFKVDSSGNVTAVGKITASNLSDYIMLTLDGGGEVITTGSKGYRRMPYDCTVTGWSIFGDVTGSAVVSVKKATYASWPTMTAISGTEPPTLSSAIKNEDNTLTSWTTSITAGDMLEFNVDSASTVTKLWIFIAVLMA